MTEVVSIEKDGPEAAREALDGCVGRGGVAVFPADTLYGLACDPLNERAVQRIRQLKRREREKPTAVMYFSVPAIREIVEPLGSKAREAVGALLPGPVTLVLSNPERRYPIACGRDAGKLGVRLIDGPLAGAAHPVFQTSANGTGESPPARFSDVDGRIAGTVDLAIDGGELGGAPSTVVDLSGIDAGMGWKLLREGALSEAEIAKRLG